MQRHKSRLVLIREDRDLEQLLGLLLVFLLTVLAAAATGTFIVGIV